MKESEVRTTRLLGTIALVAIVSGLVASLALLAIRRDLNPVEHGVSLYALGPRGIVQSFAILAVGFGSLLLAAGLRRALPGGPGARSGAVCLTLWGLLIAVAAIAPLDITPPMSLAGIVHDIAGNGANLFLIAGVLLVRSAVADDASWRALFVASLPLAVAALAAVVVANVARPIVPWGIGQRIYLLLLLSWLILAAVRLSRFRLPERGNR